MMISFARYGKILTLCILLCLAASCSTVETASKPRDPVQPRPQVSTDHRAVLNAWKAEHARNPGNPDVMRNYAKAVEGMKGAADKAYEAERYASAGRIYGMLLKSYPGFKRFAQSLSFDRPELKNRLSDCKAALYQKGFAEYRNNRLNEAILSWQGLLSIDPGNEDIRKAVNTAVLQRKNLR